MTDRDPIAEALEELRKREAAQAHELTRPWTGGTEKEAQAYLFRRGIEVINFARINNQTYTRPELLEMLHIDSTDEQMGADEVPNKPVEEDVIFLRVHRKGEPIHDFVHLQLDTRGYRPADLDETLAALHEVGCDDDGAHIASMASLYRLGSGIFYHPVIKWHQQDPRPLLGVQVGESMEKLDIIPVVRVGQPVDGDILNLALKAALRKTP